MSLRARAKLRVSQSVNYSENDRMRWDVRGGSRRMRAERPNNPCMAAVKQFRSRVVPLLRDRRALLSPEARFGLNCGHDLVESLSSLQPLGRPLRFAGRELWRVPACRDAAPHRNGSIASEVAGHGGAARPCRPAVSTCARRRSARRGPPACFRSARGSPERGRRPLLSTPATAIGVLELRRKLVQLVGRGGRQPVSGDDALRDRLGRLLRKLNQIRDMYSSPIQSRVAELGDRVLEYPE